MIFKVNWEKTHTTHYLTDDLIKKMLTMLYPETEIKNFEIIAGGCANINIKVNLKNSDAPVILRVYLRDPSSAYREQKIAIALKEKVPVPKIYYTVEMLEYTFTITEYLPGTSLRDLLLSKNKCDVGQIMFKVGKVLSSISAIKFDKSGFFNKNLEIAENITRDGFVKFCFSALNDKKVQSILSAEELDQIKTFFRAYKNFLPDDSEKNLVHADFDPANILVKEINGEIEISGILDWEFAFLGSTLCDVANMLRYAHQMPKEYQDSFLEGLTSSGYKLPNHWQTTINLLNILSLLDCLKRSDPENRPNQISDIKEIIRHILFNLQKVEVVPYDPN